MSIIHDALKKAQQKKEAEYEHSAGDPGTGEGIHKTTPRVLAVLAVLVGITALVVTGFRIAGTFTRGDRENTSLQTTTPVPPPQSTGRNDVVKIKVSSLETPGTSDLARQAERLFWLGDLTGAEEMFRKALLNGDGNDPELSNNLGLVQMKKGDLAQALKLFDHAIGEDPGLKEAFCNRGVVFRKMRQYSNAKSDLEKALSMAPDYSHAQFNLATVYEAMGQKADAITYYRKYLSNPDRTPGLDEPLIRQRVSALEAEVSSVSWPKGQQKKGR